MKAKNMVRYAIATALILSLPLVAMQFTDEVQWGLPDFIIIGTLLMGAGFMFELVAARVDAKYRVLLAVATVIAVLLIWAELAVGIFGTPFAGS